MEYTEATIEAIRKSLKKWDDIAHGNGVDYFSSNCALCERFLGHEDVRKDRCPLNPYRDRETCGGQCAIEWRDWDEHHTLHHANDEDVNFVHIRQEGCSDCDELSEKMYRKLKEIYERIPKKRR